jgi:O-antigen/teichoic acid export membrane protein
MTNGIRALRQLAVKPSALAVRVGYNGVAQLAPIIVMFAVTPLLLHRLGLDRFSIWSLALVILGTLTTLDGGVAASLARFFAIYAARGDREDTGRLLLASFGFFALLGAGLTAIAFPLAPAIVDLFHMPAHLKAEAAVVIRWLPALATLALLEDATAALLQGNARFRALAGSMVASTATFAIAIVVLVQPGAHLRELMVATALRFAVAVVVGLALVGRQVSIRRPLLPSRTTTRVLGRYTSRMQLSAITGFVNTQMDALVIAALLPLRYVGLYTIGMQAASAVRSLPLYAFAPLLTRLTMLFRNEGRGRAADEFEHLESRWLPAVLGYGVVAIVATGFSVPVWLGDRYMLSGVVAAILLSGYMVHVALTGMRTCYVRAIGRPGLETRYSLVWTIGNSLITIPLALLAGVVGVVAATAVTGIVASIYFVALCHRTERLGIVLPSRHWWTLAAAAVGLTAAGELLIVYTGLHGFLALALTGLPALAGLALFATGYRRTPDVSLAS